jgi:LysM repeat protein
MRIRDAGRQRTHGPRAIRVLHALCAATLLAPGSLRAQQSSAAPATQSYTVKAGDTLWELAQAYLKDPHLWTEIFKLNKEKIADPHWIYPGQVLLIPGASSKVEVPAVSEAPPKPVAAPMQVVSAPPVPPQPVPVQRPVQLPATPQGATVFAPPLPPAQSTGGGADVSAPPRTVLLEEYITAPYVVRPDTKLSAGRIIRSSDIAGTAHSSQTPIFKEFDGVFIEVPPGEVAAEGQRYVSVRLGPEIDGVGQVVIPTGILQVTQAPRGDEASQALLVKAFGEVGPNQLLLPLDTSGVASTARPQAINDGRWATVKWVLSQPVLPSLQAYIVLDVSANDDVRPGDEFLIFEPQSRAAIGLGSPEIAIGKAQAVKVTPYGTTAIVISLRQPAVRPGVLARTSAKMPR